MTLDLLSPASHPWTEDSLHQRLAVDLGFNFTSVSLIIPNLDLGFAFTSIRHQERVSYSLILGIHFYQHLITWT
ncbi:hypothetical protein Csa_004688 [Cucumis sativus]|uniref:Uncharacterized protein n=1 Tax=Cucumis sativus TaxID=3659 RepID=A0A0A0KPL1_CUCSA|nr:hypothetical protein Csa_004688 [Cucumis sativus]